MSTPITDLETFQAHVNSSQRVTIVKFTASWCGPCKKIAPLFDRLAKAHPDAVFLTVDVDDNPDASAFGNVRAMPTFQVYCNGAKTAECVGGDHERLQALVNNNLKVPLQVYDDAAAD